MSLMLLAVRDLKTDSYLGHHVALARGAAVRQFGDACVDSNSFLAKHPEDYQLMHLADVDERTGSVSPMVAPQLLCSASDFAAVPQVRHE